jgi:hypothetical protein
VQLGGAAAEAAGGFCLGWAPNALASNSSGKEVELLLLPAAATGNGSLETTDESDDAEASARSL